MRVPDRGHETARLDIMPACAERTASLSDQLHTSHCGMKEANPGLRRARWILRVALLLAAVGVAAVTWGILRETVLHAEMHRYDAAGLVGDGRPFAGVQELAAALRAEMSAAGRSGFLVNGIPGEPATIAVYADWFDRRAILAAMERRGAQGVEREPR
jgi:hypothetical protein